MTIALNWHNPPTAIAIVALQEVGLVCGGSKDIVAQILYWLATIGRAHTVATTAKESLCRLCIVGSFHTVQFAYLDNPAIRDSLNLFLIATCERERVVKPSVTYDFKKCTLANTLWPWQSEHIVELTTRLKGTSNSCHKPQLSLFSDERSVLCTKIVDDGSLNARCAVPFLFADIILNWVEIALRSGSLQHLEHFVLGKSQVIVLFQVVLNLPYGFFIYLVPIDVAEQWRKGDVVLAEGVKANLTEILIMCENHPKIADGLQSVPLSISG